MAAIDDRRDSEIHKVLRHHDSQLTQLAVEVGAIKNSVSEQGQVLHEIRGALSDLRGNQGPGFGHLLKGLVTGGALIAMSAGAITVLVTSFVAPDLTKLRTEAAYAERFIARATEEDRRELSEYRRRSSESIEKRLEQLTRRFNESGGWRVETKRN